MADYLFLYDTQGALTPFSQDSTMAHSVSDPIVAWATDGTPSAQDVWMHSERYQWQNHLMQVLPYMDLTWTCPSGPDGVNAVTYTLTISAIGSNPPSEATLSVAGSTITVPLTNGIGTQMLVFHPCLATSTLVAGVIGDGHVPCTVTINVGSSGPAPMQLLPSSPPTIAPLFKYQVRQWLFGWGPNTDPVLGTLTDMLHESYFAICLLFDIVVNKALPSLTQASYTPVTLNADEQHALADMQANLLPNLAQTLGSIYPSSGSRDPIYGRVVAWSPSQKQAIQAYMNVIASIPNLT